MHNDPQDVAVVDPLADLWRSTPALGPWVEDAACGALDMPEVFTATTKPDAEELALVERVCRRCSVRQECAGYAATADVWGVWAGHWYSGRVVRHAAA